MTGEFRLKRQLNGVGYFGAVHLEIEEHPFHQVRFASPMDEENNYSVFEDAITFGINYGLSEYRRLKSDHRHFKIMVTKHYEMAVDSSPTILAYVAAKAVFNAFEIDSEATYPVLNEEEETFIFRK